MHKKKSRYTLRALTLAIVLCLTACSAHADRPEIHQFIEKMVEKHHFDREELRTLFNSVSLNRSVLSSFIKPTENLTWSDYRLLFVTEKRVHKGVVFWKTHSDTLRLAQQRYGVPPSIVIAILGMETRYGETMGSYRVLDALSTLSFNHTRRTGFFQHELEEFLLLCRENPCINARKTRGSYAGAIGQVQFLPSNYRRLAVDASTKGYSDLIHNTDDAILSVAHYLQVHGWMQHEPIAVSARVEGHGLNPLPTSTQCLTPKTLKKYGIYPEKPLPPRIKASLVTLPLTQGQEYWLGCKNFQVIKRYNASSLYAMAVSQLSELIDAHHQQKNRTYA